MSAADATVPIEGSADRLVAAWRRGAGAFARGEIPPVHPDESEGWYFAESAATRLGLVPAATSPEIDALAGGWPAIARWALPRAVAGTAAVGTLLLALALVGVR